MATILEELQGICLEERKLCTDDYIEWVLMTKTTFPTGYWHEIRQDFRRFVRSL
jgi:hypothetical protein